MIRLTTICAALLLFGLWLAPMAPAYSQDPVLINQVVAGVSGEPITLYDLNHSFSPPRALQLNEINQDPAAQRMLNSLIAEKIITQEGRSQNISVQDQEVDHYINEVAQRNNLSLAAFKVALAEEGLSLETYRRQTRFEILKAKLASRMVQEGIGITDQEVDDYLADQPALISADSKIKLAQIFVSFEGKSPAAAQEQMEQIRRSLDQGADFVELAASFSESPESGQGGALGILAEADLAPAIQKAISGLGSGEISKTIGTPLGLHIFLVEARLGGTTDPEQLRESVRRLLRERRQRQKIDAYFTEEIFKKYTVERYL